MELASYGNGKFYRIIPKEFKKITDDFKLKILSTHNGLSPRNVDRTIEDGVVLGVEYIVLPFFMNNPRQSMVDYKNLCDQLNSHGEAFAKSGMEFAYHNYAFEFELKDGQIPYDILLEGTDEKNVSIEIDLYWIKKPDMSPWNILINIQANLPYGMSKIKMQKSENYTEIGNGNINFEEIFTHASKAGMQYFFVELDNSQRPALEKIKISFDYLNKADYVR